MGRRASTDEDGLREAPLLPGLSPPSEDEARRADVQRGAVRIESGRDGVSPSGDGSGRNGGPGPNPAPPTPSRELGALAEPPSDASGPQGAAEGSAAAWLGGAVASAIAAAARSCARPTEAADGDAAERGASPGGASPGGACPGGSSPGRSSPGGASPDDARDANARAVPADVGDTAMPEGDAAEAPPRRDQPPDKAPEAVPNPPDPQERPGDAPGKTAPSAQEVAPAPFADPKGERPATAPPERAAGANASTPGLLPLDQPTELPAAARGGKAPRPSAREADAASRLDHRKRLRERFMQGGPDAMPDYELLELVLFRAIPRRDVKPLAKRLLAAFGDFNHTISAPPARLAEVSGVGDAVVQELKIVEAAAHRLARARVIGKDAIQTWEQLVDYCRARLAHEATEQFRVLYLDRKNILIADEAQGRGTVDHVPVYPREVIKRALELGASALILVHNHPSGDPSPSRADVDMTRRIMEACEPLGVTVHDHVIVGKKDVASFHSLGLLDP